MILPKEIEKIVDKLEEKNNHDGVQAVLKTAIYYLSKQISKENIFDDVDKSSDVVGETFDVSMVEHTPPPVEPMPPVNLPDLSSKEEEKPQEEEKLTVEQAKRELQIED